MKMAGIRNFTSMNQSDSSENVLQQMDEIAAIDVTSDRKRNIFEKVLGGGAKKNRFASQCYLQKRIRWILRRKDEASLRCVPPMMNFHRPVCFAAAGERRR